MHSYFLGAILFNFVSIYLFLVEIDEVIGRGVRRFFGVSVVLSQILTTGINQLVKLTLNTLNVLDLVLKVHVAVVLGFKSAECLLVDSQRHVFNQRRKVLRVLRCGEVAASLSDKQSYLFEHPELLLIS